MPKERGDRDRGPVVPSMDWLEDADAMASAIAGKLKNHTLEYAIIIGHQDSDIHHIALSTQDKGVLRKMSDRFIEFAELGGE